MPQLDDILVKLNQLAEEVQELKARSTEAAGHRHPEAALMDIAEQVRAHIAGLDHDGQERFICHCIVEGTGGASVQLTWLGAMAEDDSYSTARYCLALANEHRIRILKALAWDEKTAAQLTEGTGLEGGPLYHHLKELIAARFVRQKERSCYQITREGLDAILTVCAMNRRNTWESKGEFWHEEEDHGN